MALVGMAANLLVPTRPPAIGPAERDGACPVWQWCGVRLSPDQPPQHRHHAAFANQQQQHDGGEHHFDPAKPVVRLLPSLGADRLVHGEPRRDIILAHCSVPCPL